MRENHKIRENWSLRDTETHFSQLSSRSNSIGQTYVAYYGRRQIWWKSHQVQSRGKNTDQCVMVCVMVWTFNYFQGFLRTSRTFKGIQGKQGWIFQSFFVISKKAVLVFEHFHLGKVKKWKIFPINVFRE